VFLVEQIANVPFSAKLTIVGSIVCFTHYWVLSRLVEAFAQRDIETAG
jgi:hypothetical protein